MSIIELESDTDEDQSQTYGLLLAIGGTFLFALKSIFIKFAFADGANPTSLLATRLLLSAPLYIGVLVYSRRQASNSLDPKTIFATLMLGFLGYYLASFLDMSGLRYISAQLERLTLFTYPALVAVLASLFLGEKFTGRVLVSLLLCYAGIWLMYAQESMFSESDNVTLGVLLVLGSALSYSLYVLFAKRMIEKLGSRDFTCLAMLGSAGFVCAHFLCTQPLSTLTDNPSVWGYGSLLAFVSTVLPSFMLSEAISRIGATKSTIIGAIGPVLTILLAIVFLKEPSSVSHFAGMAIVLVGVAVLARK